MYMCTHCYTLFKHESHNCQLIDCRGICVEIDDAIAIEVSVLNKLFMSNDVPLRTAHSCSSHTNMHALDAPKNMLVVVTSKNRFADPYISFKLNQKLEPDTAHTLQLKYASIFKMLLDETNKIINVLYPDVYVFKVEGMEPSNKEHFYSIVISGSFLAYPKLMDMHFVEEVRLEISHLFKKYLRKIVDNIEMFTA